MSTVIDVQQFLVGKTLRIPPYQRDYAWTTDQVEDLFDDVQEAIDSRTGNYLGTVVLAQGTDLAYEIVDGQQRLATLTIMVQALLQQLATSDLDRIACEAILLRHGISLKLDFGNNASFVSDLFADKDPSPASAGQRKLSRAFIFSRDRARALSDQGGDALIKRWLDAIKKLEIIQFAERDMGRAIRMFQTVNDRGLPLTAMDKAKALLVYYSNRHLAGALDHHISTCFGFCFSAFDAVREFVEDPGFRIDNVARETFTEDDILRYHYLSYSHSDAVNAGDYDGSVRTVFDGFLKGTLKALSHEPQKLRSFIEDYSSDLGAFSQAFQDMLMATATSERLFKYFVVLGVNARLYPLTIRLQQRNLLFSPVDGTTADLLQCLEVCDVRVYKTRGTSPAKDIGNLSHRSRQASVQEIANSLRNFLLAFQSDGEFLSNLTRDTSSNQAVPLILLAHDEQSSGSAYCLPDLVGFVRAKITREHIIAQTPNFQVTSHGFADDEEFRVHQHMLGNLTLLTGSENSRCFNKAVHTKMTDPKLYAHSAFAGARALAHQYVTSGGAFNKPEVVARAQSLANFALSRWSIS